MKPSVLAPLLALAGAALVALPAHAQLKARVVSRSDPSQGVLSKVLMLRNGTQSMVGQTLPDGQGVLSVASCDASMMFRASPIQTWAWSSSQNDWKPCSGDRVDLQLSPADGFASFMTPFTVDADAFGPGTQMAAWQDQLQTAGYAGDSARVAYLSNEMAYSLNRAGNTSMAADYSALAIVAGGSSLSDLGFSIEGSWLAFAPEQNRYVATPETLNALSYFKTQQGLGGAKTIWDGQTFQRIEALTSANNKLPSVLSTNEP